jgi:hypothetical protein
MAFPLSSDSEKEWTCFEIKRKKKKGAHFEIGSFLYNRELLN